MLKSFSSLCWYISVVYQLCSLPFSKEVAEDNDEEVSSPARHFVPLFELNICPARYPDMAGNALIGCFFRDNICHYAAWVGSGGYARRQ